ncbi:MAG: PD40 domain-containing protein [Planctomycetes bacterium]|nr:PD40 domain-containing protein [Planctomycetota bacterium]
MIARTLSLIVLVAFNVSSVFAQQKPSGYEVSTVKMELKTSSAESAKSAPGETTHRPHAGMLRFPDISDKYIVFEYSNDLWLAPREGGVASPLASPPGQESFPRFSPDGKTIAFVGNYEGNRDLYTMSIDGGTATRVTYHPGPETLCDWTPDGKQLIYFTNGFAGSGRIMQLYTTSAEGGLPAKLPVPYGANGSISADGRWLAYTTHTADGRTWKRYRGGMATDVWLFDLKDHSAKKITDWEGTDSQPMWHDKKVYYMSDQGESHRLNIWVYDTETSKREQVTRLTDYDVKWPSMGPGPDGKGELIFQNGPNLTVLSLTDGKTRDVEIVIPGDRPRIRPKDFDGSKYIQAADISPTGQRAVFQVRGDVWTVPAKKGSPRNLTRSNDVADRDPSWSPDGQWIAYFSDATGEYELYITQSDGRGETKKLTSDGKTYRFSPTWSPDSKYIAFTDRYGAIFLHNIGSGETKLVDIDPFGNMGRLSWASDSNWIAYTKSNDTQVTSSVWLYKLDSGDKRRVTAPAFNCSWPTFDRKGDYLFYASNRNFNSPAYEDVGTTFVYADTDTLFVVPLRDEVGSPFAPKSDEEKFGEDKKKEEAEKDKDKDKDKEKDKGDKDKDKEKKKDDKKEPASFDKNSAEKSKDEKDKSAKDSEKKTDAEEKDDTKKSDKKEEAKPVTIETEGFERRAVALPVDRGSFTNLAVNHEGKLLYVRNPRKNSEEKAAIKIFDLKDDDKKEKGVLDDVGQFDISADGKKILVRKDQNFSIVDAGPDQKLDKHLALADMVGHVDPRIEWKQIFREAWRIQRDYFYDPNMHGLDWNMIYDQYSRMLADCSCREDVDYVIGEMISELNVGHAYVFGGGDTEKAPEVGVGLLELHDGGYRFSKIYEGAAWDYDARGPLSQPGIKVKVGDYLLAVNGTPVDTKKDPWAALHGLAGKVVTLTVSDKAAIDKDARQVVVETLKSEADLRYRAWIEHNRSYVEQRSNGRIGYVYVPSTGINGQNDLFRQYYGQLDKEAMVIDERWNSGGQIPTRFIELLNRPITNFWATRADKDGSWPPDANGGPKCMLINGLAGSGGDCFPYYFRQAKLGKLIGMRNRQRRHQRTDVRIL